MVRACLTCLVFVAATALARTQTHSPGQSYFGRANYVEYIAGDLPLILTAGHGGDRTPAEIPARTVGTSTTDGNTRELALAVADEIFARTGKYPHVVINHLARSRLDPNREIVEAAQGNVHAEQAWREFHGFIAAARSAAEVSAGFGFVVDIHGHGHSVARLELGYLLGASQLNLSDAELSRPGYLWRSSLRTLGARRPGVGLVELLRGPRGLGELFNARGRPAWPSATYPTIGDADFFNGGYITATHTCILDNGVVHGVQIECNRAGVRDTADNRAAFGTAFANVIQPYLWDNYGYDIGTLSFARLAPPSPTALSRGGGGVTVTVTRTGYLGLASTLALSFGGSATRGSGGDYASSATSVTFARNVATASFTLTPAAIGPVFGDRTIEIALAPSDTQTADTTPLVLTLGDNLSQTVRVETAQTSLAETDANGAFRLTRTQSASALTVPLVWTGDAVPGVDYVASAAEAVFPVGATEVLVPFTVIDDGVSEPDKTITLRPAANAAYRIGHPPLASAALRDDDRHPALVAWYPGTITGNRLVDASGAARHATTLPAGRGPASESNGESVSARFGGAEDTIVLPRMKLDSAAGFTLAFHFRVEPGATATNQNFASLGNRATPGSLNVYLSSDSTLRTALHPAADTVSADSLDVPGAWTEGAWHHYAVTAAADGTRTVYIDGVARRSAGGWSGRLSTTDLLWLGWKPENDASTAFLRGNLRDVRVYSRPLDTSEIAAVANDRLSFSAWLAHWSLPSGAGSPSDPLAEGRAALLDYALGARPGAASAPAQQTRFENGRLVLQFLRQTSAGDLAWIVEASDDLGLWQTLARLDKGASAWTLSPGVSLTETSGLVTVTDSATGSTPPLRRFLRVRVES